MYIVKIVVKNYKLLKDVEIALNSELNIFVGDNDAGKSTLLEALSILTSGKINGYSFERQLRASWFNSDVRREYIQKIESGETPEPPTILFEAYCSGGDGTYSGTNNTLSEDCEGIHVECYFNPRYMDTYHKMLADKTVKDIPVEMYTVSYDYFNGSPLSFRYSPFKSVFIDTTKKDYFNMLNHFVSDSITENLTEDELTDLATAYRDSRRQFHENAIVQKLNESVKRNVVIPDRSISLDLKEDDSDGWKKQMSVVVDEVPFDSIGFGSQNTIKIELAIKNAEEQANVVLMEEPENNLSFTNMSLLIRHVIEATGKQIFISTHSSYIANKLNLDNVILVNNGATSSYKALGDETKKYFVKLPGYDTLRFALAKKVILVEGPTDDLIVQRAYLDAYGKLPIDDGIDVIVVDSLAFKRYADIAILMEKLTVIVTDNDGDIEKNIKKKYEGYIGNKYLIFIHESNEALKTIEPSVLAANSVGGVPTETFKKVISANNSMMRKNYDEILHFMSDNKAEWAFRVFEHEERINYPEYIKDVIKQYH